MGAKCANIPELALISSGWILVPKEMWPCRSVLLLHSLCAGFAGIDNLGGTKCSSKKDYPPPPHPPLPAFCFQFYFFFSVSSLKTRVRVLSMEFKKDQKCTKIGNAVS